jgi:hypothetical protein
MFDSFMETSRVNHQAFMNQQESRFESSQNNAIASMNAQSTPLPMLSAGRPLPVSHSSQV